MAFREDPGFIPAEVFRRLYGYENVEHNIYDHDLNAFHEMQVRIRNNVRFNAETGIPFPCGCGDRDPFTRRCMLPNCETHLAGFECPEACDVLYPSPCTNRDLSTENFEHAVTILAHRDPARGLGLFLTRDVRANIYVGEVRGVLGMGNILPNRFCFEIGRDFQPVGGQMLYLDLSNAGNEFRYLNTSCTPNAVLICKAVGTELRLGVRTTRRIRENEELTVTYTEAMLNFINNHNCGRQQCPIRRSIMQRELQPPLFPLPPPPPPPQALPPPPPSPPPERQEANTSKQDQSTSCGRKGEAASQPSANVKEYLLDPYSSAVYFPNPGLGPIQWTGCILSATRKIKSVSLVLTNDKDEVPDSPQDHLRKSQDPDPVPRASVSGCGDILQEANNQKGRLDQEGGARNGQDKGGEGSNESKNQAQNENSSFGTDCCGAWEADWYDGWGFDEEERDYSNEGAAAVLENENGADVEEQGQEVNQEQGGDEEQGRDEEGVPAEEGVEEPVQGPEVDSDDEALVYIFGKI